MIFFFLARVCLYMGGVLLFFIYYLFLVHTKDFLGAAAVCIPHDLLFLLSIFFFFLFDGIFILFYRTLLLFHCVVGSFIGFTRVYLFWGGGDGRLAIFSKIVCGLRHSSIYPGARNKQSHSKQLFTIIITGISLCALSTNSLVILGGVKWQSFGYRTEKPI